MLKKIITISLLGVSALAIMNVNAATTSDATQAAQPAKTATQGATKACPAAAPKHHAKRHHHAKAAPVAANDSVDTSSQMQTLSVQPSHNGFVPAGLYVTGQLGYAQNGLKLGLPAIESFTHASNGIAGRVAMGYKVTNNLAMEVGFLDLKKGSKVVDVIGAQSNNAKLTSNQYAIDVDAKGILPVAQNVNVYGKVGVAYLTTHLNAQTGAVKADINKVDGIAKHNWAPEVAVGVSYDVTPNVSVDTSITHIQPVGSKHPGNIDFMAVGVGYTFG